ncbi:glycosyltransferase [Bremerella cremea]|uniref:Glycosyl transferase family 1 n=1 Tax=Blastopirellula marina TaxID=124 RepID=A0A2S8F995_9BACT|nr:MULTISPECIES: glycosyltransferase [Pirellulaceae]PQO28504.1 glycosyl transferase family 1 [Blastopirellula marina]RCS41874.1 glycosyltransferase [Bremerella cremea]
MPERPKRILVALYHSYIDTSSGAAISLRDLMEGLARHGWEVRVFSGPRLDFEEPKTNEELLIEQGIHFKTYKASDQGVDIRLSLFRSNGVDCGVWVPSDPQASPSKAVGTAWLNAYREVLESWRPDLVITYGGFWMTGPLTQLARNARARTVFYLCNYAYKDAKFFQDFDVTITLSNFHAQWYRENVGIESVPIYPLMPRERYVCAPDPERRFVTFVNPQPHKGVFVFAKIAEVLGKRRPDIPLLVVEGRASVDWLARTGADLSQANLHRMQNTPDPREYLRVTHSMLMPSVWQESFGRVAAEAMMNGIPVIGSDRGSLPEVIGDGGVLLEIPERIRPETQLLPTEEEVEDWVRAVAILWDENDHPLFFAEAIERANNWSEYSIVDNFARI